jgi:pimeloyl-ACP methyl ester carboxylesterase
MAITEETTGFEDSFNPIDLLLPDARQQERAMTIQQHQFLPMLWAGRNILIEYQWVGIEDPAAPVMIFLHEGLGSVSMWRDFPDALCTAAQCRGLVYSRPGYGRSTTRPPEELWNLDFMHRQAHELLPELLTALSIDPRRDRIWLFGHSDGGSITLLYAARYVEALAGAVVLAPHIMVEDITITGIEKTRQAYLETDLRSRLGRHHDDPDSPFWGWNRIWLDPRFKDWSIEEEMATIHCPLLAVQGVDDEYGSLEQIRGIARCLPHTTLLELEACGHSPHRDQRDQLIAAVVTFMRTPMPRAPSIL